MNTNTPAPSGVVSIKKLCDNCGNRRTEFGRNGFGECHPPPKAPFYFWPRLVSRKGGGSKCLDWTPIDEHTPH